MIHQKAQRVIDFVERFGCQKNGRPLRLLPWQTDIIAKLYGTLNEQGLRVYRQLFAFVPRRNGKSVFVACLLIYHLVCEPTKSEIYILSNTLTQSADSVFDACLTMVRNSPKLRARLKPLASKGRIINKKTGSRIAVLSSTTSGLMGRDSMVQAFDEVGFFRDRRIVANMKGSQLNQQEPLSLYITTASDMLDGVGKEIHDYAVKVRDGVIEDPSFLPAIFAADPADDWQSPETWRKANPSLGILFQEEDLAKLAREAQAEPRKQSEFKQFHLNLWQHASICWLTKETWDNCRAEFSEDDMLGKRCFCGIDLARRHDLAAIVYVFPVDDLFYLLPKFFLPRAGIEAKSLSDHAPLTTWAEQGFLTLTDGDVIDYQVIRDTIKADAKKFRIEELGYDPWSGELLCNQQLRQEDNINCVEVRQRIDMISPATMQFERLLKEKRIRHNGHPVMNWHAGNAAVRTDANGNISLDKKHSKARMDGMAAAVIALSRCINDPQGESLILL